jgi:hypothetical protein
MKSLKNLQENPSNFKEQILGIFSNVSDLLKNNNFTEALSTLSSHFRVHLDQAFQTQGSQRAPIFFVDSIVSEYFLFRPFPNDSNQSNFVKTENSRALQLTAALIILEMYKLPNLDLSASQTLSDPQVITEIQKAREWLK